MISNATTKRVLVHARLAHRQRRFLVSSNRLNDAHKGNVKEWKVRDFIKRSLYEQEAGYFSVVDCVYKNEDAVDFRKLAGKHSYQRELGKLYKARAQSWLTPVEIFQPWYSRALGKYLLHAHGDSKKPLKIYEVGGGNGTNAYHILEYIQAHSKQVYDNMSYVLVEVSDTMAQRQREFVGKAHPKQCEVVHADFLDWDRYVEKEECFIVAMEVLDNLPHDKLARKIDPTKKGEGDQQDWWVYKSEDHADWLETHVQSATSQDGDEKETFKEVQVPLSDELAIRTAKMFLRPSGNESYEEGEEEEEKDSLNGKDVNESKGFSFFGWMEEWARKSLKNRRDKIEQKHALNEHPSVFIPTGSMKLLETLRDKFPNHRLLVADFDDLPAPDISTFSLWRQRRQEGSIFGCKNAPLVAGSDSRGNSIDFPTYLVPVGTADIFFQTDFNLLGSAYQQLIGRRPKIIHSRRFLEEFSEHRYTQTRSGYNPMLEDYYNTKFLVS